MTRNAISTDKIPPAAGPFSAGIEHGGVLYCSGQGPYRADGSLAGTDIASQTRQTLANLQAVAEAAGTSLANALQVRVFLTSMENFAAMNEVYAGFFNELNTNPFPARTTVETGLPIKEMLVEIDVTVAVPQG